MTKKNLGNTVLGWFVVREGEDEEREETEEEPEPPPQRLAPQIKRKPPPPLPAADAPPSVRLPGNVLLPTPRLRREINSVARAVSAGLVMLDPALPLGAIGPSGRRTALG